MLQEAGVNMQMNVYPASAGYAHPRMYMVRNIFIIYNLHKILHNHANIFALFVFVFKSSSCVIVTLLFS
jgi:hypothetical protein